MTRKFGFAIALIAACGGDRTLEKEPVTDTFTDQVGFEDKADQFTGKMTMLGSIAYGQTKGPFTHVAGKWSALSFLGNAGDELVIDVKSNNGDTVAWLVDKSMNILAFDDDSGAGTNSRITHTLADGANTTFFIVTREYSRRAMRFSVTLQGKHRVDYASPCTADAECVLANSACCGGNYVAVRADQSSAFHGSLSCDPRLACPITAPPADLVAQCESNRCVAVKAADIDCGGRRINPHTCPAGYQCEGPALAVDGTGKCVKRCGGIAGFQCDGDDICVDDPNDSCDPSANGADCMGSCRAAICSGATSRCQAGYHWDQWACNCVENTSCGGFAGFPCAPGKVCIDAPDSCDPDNGGADCPGMCVAQTDCRAGGCGNGQYCSYCWGSFQCIPDGALC